MYIRPTLLLQRADEFRKTLLGGSQTTTSENFVMLRQERFSDELVERFKAKLTPAADGQFFVEDLLFSWVETQAELFLQAQQDALQYNKRIFGKV